MSTALAIKDEEGVPAGVLTALENIRATLKIQVSKGNEEAAWILKHL
jgi:hypothetical protein